MSVDHEVSGFATEDFFSGAVVPFVGAREQALVARIASEAAAIVREVTECHATLCRRLGVTH